MQTIVKEICNAIEDRDDLTFIKVAQYINASKQCMSKLKNKSEIGFRYLLRLSYLLFPDNQKEKMEDWCMRVDTVESIKQSFEYAAITRSIGLLNNLIIKYANEKGTIGEYVAIYSIIHRYMINVISGFDLIAHVKKFKSFKDEALNILVEIIKCYNYYFESKFTKMIDTAREAEKRLLSINDKRELFIKECFLHRIAEVLGPAYLHLNNLKLARHYAFTIINADICPKTVSDASYIVGMSYLLEDKGKCLAYLQKSYDIAKTTGDSHIENEARLNLDFAKLYLNVELAEDSDITLINFQENRASEINLNLVKEVMSKKGDDELVILFETVASKSLVKMYETFQTFLSQTNLFFASLVAKEIQKNGDTSGMVETMIKFTLKLEESVYFEKDYISSFNNFGNCRSGGICA